METLPTTKKTQALDAKRFIAGEVNLSRLPFFASSTKGLKKKISIVYRYTKLVHGQEIEAVWEVSANAKYGYPGPFAEAVHMAILQIVTERGFPAQNPIVFAFYDICKRLEIKYNTRNRRRIRRAILSIRFAGIEIGHSFTTKNGRTPIFTDTPTLYRRALFIGDLDPQTHEPLDYSAIWIEDFYLNSLNSGHFRPLDFEYFKQIRKASYASTKIYSYLGYRFAGSCFKHNNDYAKVDYNDLAVIADIERQRYKSKAKEKLAPAHRELQRTDFLAREPVWQVEKQGRGKPNKFYILYYPGKRAREEYRRGRRQLTRQLEMFEGGGETPTPEITNELVALGVTESRAVRIAKRYSTTQINLQLDHLAYLGEVGRPIMENVGGWLADAIEKSYTPPKGFKTREEREARSKTQAQAEAQQRQTEQEDDRQRAEQFTRYQELDTQLATLPTTDQQRIREEIEARLREGFNDFMIRRYATKPFDPTSALHRAEYYRHLTELLSHETHTAPHRATQSQNDPRT